MTKMEVLEKMMNSENGGLYAAIAGIVVVYGIDRITKNHYKMDAKKDSLTLAPVEMAAQEKAQPAPETKPAAKKKATPKKQSSGQ